MADIVKFPEPKGDEKVVWVCACGCMSFELCADGQARCQHCGCVASDREGGWQLPEPPAQDEAVQPEVGARSIVTFQSSGPALERTIAHAEKPKTTAVVVIKETGAVHAWGDIEPHAKEWFLGRLDVATKMLCKD